MAKCWATMEMISAVLCFTSCFPFLPPLLYKTQCSAPARGLYLLPKSLFPMVFTFEHQPCPHNRWLQYSVSLIGHRHCQSHTCDADTAGKEVCFCRPGLCPRPLYPPSPCSMPSGGFSFPKPPSNHRRTPQLFVSFWTPKIQPLTRPLSPLQPSSHSLHSHVSHLILSWEGRSKYGRR